MTIEYGCGDKYVIPVALQEDQTLLANAPLGDTLIALADASHDQTCLRCKESP